MIKAMDVLRKHDPGLVELPSGNGGVLLSPGLQGRIFCHLGGELIHRLDPDRLRDPSPGEFNNVGGNSLWPAPEGGPFAFNYLPGSNRWCVQRGVAEVNPVITHRDGRGASVEKDVVLTNRMGVDVAVKFRRLVATLDPEPSLQAFGLQTVGYESTDTIVPLAEYEPDKVLIAPWSLEQFAGGERVVCFCKVDDPQHAINFDFYGDPRSRIACRDGHFTFTPGGFERHQIGIRVDQDPRLIGALDAERLLLIIRKTVRQEGSYFNIADNEQPNGPYSASDLYSIFSGGSTGFYELETVGSMRIVHGRIAESGLRSTTLILRGPMQELTRYLATVEGIYLEEAAACAR